jgi:hypothetical protein
MHGGSGFDFTEQMRALCDDIVVRSPRMRHIDMSRVAIAFARSRKDGPYGIWAALTPLRFASGALEEIRDGRRVTCQRLYGDGVEMLYILNFYLPRFLDLTMTEKLTTIFHELWHISPDFNGDLRRFPGRCYAHTHDERQYDATMNAMARQWLALAPPESLYTFLQCSFRELQQRYGTVYGTRIAHPKIIPLAG